jgi:hypothetical protein
MSSETAAWISRILPALCLVGVGTFAYIRAKRGVPTSYPPGKGLRFFDQKANEVVGRKRIVLRSLTVLVLICLLAAAVLPWL